MSQASIVRGNGAEEHHTKTQEKYLLSLSFSIACWIKKEKRYYQRSCYEKSPASCIAINYLQAIE